MAYNSTITRVGIDNLIPPVVAGEIIQNMPIQSAVLTLARRLPNMSTRQTILPILSTLMSAYFVNGDTGLKQTTSALWTNKVITAEELAVIVPIPSAVLDDSRYDLWAEIKPRLVEAFGVAIDAAILYGTNAPASWPSSIVTGATAAGNTASLAGLGNIFDAVLGTAGTEALVEADGFGISGHVAAITVKAKLRGLRDSVGQPVFLSNLIGGSQGALQNSPRYDLDGSPILFPMNGSMNAAVASMFSGDWNQLVYSIRQDMTWTVATEGVINDNTGAIVYNLFQQDMVALRAVMRLGWQLPNPITRLNTTDATRYPFGVLLP